VTRNRRKFSPEFKEEAAKMVVETSQPIAHVARELDVNETTLGNWVKDYRESTRTTSPCCRYRSARGCASSSRRTAS
jgi:transposase-like protein